MKICILGSHDLSGGSRGSTVYMAEALAAMGHAVTYASSQVSLLHRLAGHWGSSIPRSGAGQHGITQITSQTLLPWRVVAVADRIGAGGSLFRMNRWIEGISVGTLRGQMFDLCVASAAGTLTLVDQVRAARYVYRRNDVLTGFRGVPRALAGLELSMLRSGRIALVSCVNEYLAEDILERVPAIHTNVVPNGISLKLYETAVPDPELLPSRERNVIYVGGVTDWVDVPLIMETALHMPDHTFHIVGPWHVSRHGRSVPRNVRIHGPLAHALAVSKMKACAVGMIPSGMGNIGRMVVKPIKYYEYLAAGMGVAATTYAGEGLEPFASVGDGASCFARAILEAPMRADANREAIRNQVQTMDWASLVPRILGI